MNALKARWQQWSAKVAALSQREKWMVLAAVIAGVFMLGDTLWVTPIRAKTASLSRQADQQQKDLATLQAQMAELQGRIGQDPNIALRSSLDDVQKRLQVVERRLGEYQQALVPPEETVALLDSILRQSKGVRLLGMKTLPVEPLIPPAKGDSSSPTGAKPAASSINIYRHGFEVRLEGGYLDLLAYLSSLEKQPRQLLWQRASLTVPGPLRAELTLVFFTLSLDKAWITL